MKIERVQISNYKSLKKIELSCGTLISIIGENNTGKSNVIEALDLFFNSSRNKITEGSFFEKNTSSTIEITLEFSKLNAWEKNYLEQWISSSDKLVVKKIIKWGESPEIIPVWIQSVPEPEWLRDREISKANIDKWWETREALKACGISFQGYLGTKKPTVSEWKTAAKAFLAEHASKLEKWVKVEKEKPTGFDNILKGGLPEFILVPAVRDVLDEIKIARTNPFGRLIYALMRKIPDEQKDKVEEEIKKINELLNKVQGQERIPQIKEIEDMLKKMMCPFMECEIEIEVPFPDIEDMFSKVNLYVDDGIRTTVDTKGHGIQRSVIFSILRAYAEFARKGNAQEKDRSIIFAIEEPELYLHPQAQRAMMQALRNISDGKDQIIYSTHSSAFVDITYFDEICLMRREKLGGHWSSEVTQLSITSLIEDLKKRHSSVTPTPDSIRERYSHVYSQARSEGFFARKVVLVEGLTEEYSLPLYSEALGYNMDKEGVSVISSGGKGQIDRLLRIFNEFRIPCFVIFDGDKMGSPEAKQITKEILDLMEWTGTCPPQTITNERFTVFEEKFEKEMQKHIDNYNEIALQCKKELGLESDSGKPLIARYMARYLIAKGKMEGNVGKNIPSVIKEIVERVKVLKWEKSILQK